METGRERIGDPDDYCDSDDEEGGNEGGDADGGGADGPGDRLDVLGDSVSGDPDAPLGASGDIVGAGSSGSPGAGPPESPTAKLR